MQRNLSSLISSLVLVLTSSLLSAEGTYVRSPVQVDAAGRIAPTAMAPVVSSDGDLSVSVWVDAQSQGVHVATSDGRGLAWSTPIRIDSDILGRTKVVTEDSVSVVGSSASIYVIWTAEMIDSRPGPRQTDLYFAYSNDGGQSWTPETLLDMGIPAGTGSVADWAILAGPVPGVVAGDAVTVLFVIDSDHTSPRRLMSIASMDAGLTFLSPRTVSSFADADVPSDVEAVEAVLDGSNMHVVFVDDRAGADSVWYQCSTDAGASWFRADMAIGGGILGAIAAEPESLCLDAINGVVATVWIEQGAAVQNLYSNVSYDSGATWMGSACARGNKLGVTDVAAPSLGVSEGGEVLITWLDNRSGVSEAFLGTSVDCGTGFIERAQLSNGGASSAVVVPARGIRGQNAIVFLEGMTELPGGNSTLLATLSPDGGRTWSSNVDLGALMPDRCELDGVQATWNPLYGNLLVGFTADVFVPTVKQAFVGGLRPQTVSREVLPGIVSGTSITHFELDGFSGGDGFGWILLGEPGSMSLSFLGESRDLGIAYGPMTGLSLMDAVHFAVAIDGSGHGETLGFSHSTTADLGLLMVGVSFDSTGILREFTDARTAGTSVATGSN